MNICFLTILKSGGEYNHNHVNALYDQVQKFCNINFSFLCLTDIPDNINCRTLPLKHNWKGWWSKIEIFQFCLPDTIYFYIDLDTVIVSDITNIVTYPHKFTALGEAMLNRGITENLGSGIMSWSGDYSFLYDIFKSDPIRYAQQHRHRGDQEFIQSQLSSFDTFQNMFKGLYSYKFTLQNKDILPDDAKIIYFHGRPKPWDVKHDWLKWRYAQ